jgi:ABC-2 type transport system ATP-binding protein
MENGSGIAVKVDNLTKTYGELVAVNSVSFDIKKGEIFGLLGPNGSGKSTTIRMLCGVITPSGGSGTVLGYDIATETESIKSRIGYMSQKFSLYSDLTVDENLDFYGRIYGVEGKKLQNRKADMVIMANLKGRENELARNLSGGWKQRLALGCALVHDPDFLVLDEPTAGVDPFSRREFWRTIMELSKTGITTLVTTHYMDEASLCDRIAFIYDGDIISIDTPGGHLERSGLSSIEEVFISYVEERGLSGKGPDKSETFSFGGDLK